MALNEPPSGRECQQNDESAPPARHETSSNDNQKAREGGAREKASTAEGCQGRNRQKEVSDRVAKLIASLYVRKCTLVGRAISLNVRPCSPPRSAHHHVKPRQIQSSTPVKVETESKQDPHQGDKKGNANNKRQVLSHLIALVSTKRVLSKKQAPRSPLTPPPLRPPPRGTSLNSSKPVKVEAAQRQGPQQGDKKGGTNKR